MRGFAYTLKQSAKWSLLHFLYCLITLYDSFKYLMSRYGLLSTRIGSLEINPFKFDLYSWVIRFGFVAIFSYTSL